MKAVVVNTCNAWKEYSSFTLVGVFTNRKKFNRVLNKLIKKNDVENNTGYRIEDMTIHELHNNLKYVSLQEIELNINVDE